jgi:hypothetical protein
MENIKNLQEIQIEIKKELGGASLNHLLFWFLKQSTYKLYFGFWCSNPLNGDQIYIKGSTINSIKIIFSRLQDNREFFSERFILLNEQKVANAWQLQALNIFGQSEDFQRKLYDAMQTITDREGENDTIPHYNINH